MSREHGVPCGAVTSATVVLPKIISTGSKAKRLLSGFTHFLRVEASVPYRVGESFQILISHYEPGRDVNVMPTDVPPRSTFSFKRYATGKIAGKQELFDDIVT